MSCPQRGVSSPLLCVSDTRRQHGNVRHWDGGGRLEKPTMPLLQAHLWVLHLHNWRQGFALGSNPCCQHHNYKYLISYISYIYIHIFHIYIYFIFFIIIINISFHIFHIFHIILNHFWEWIYSSPYIHIIPNHFWDMDLVVSIYSI